MSCVDVPCERGMDWTPLVPDCNWEADIEYRHVTTEVLIVEATPVGSRILATDEHDGQKEKSDVLHRFPTD